MAQNRLAPLASAARGSHRHDEGGSARKLRAIAIPYSVLLLSLSLAGCGGWQSALDPAGPKAGHLASLIWGFVAFLGAVWFVTMAALVWSLWPRRRGREPMLKTNPGQEKRWSIIIGSAVAFTGLSVLILTGLSYAGQKSFYSARPESVTIRLNGHQWWWEATYRDEQPSRTFITANEVHIPTGERVTFELTSSDVIHSFWVPNLAGKLDLIPGTENRLQLVAEREGVYRGQCAEFCGYQHAHMGLVVVAEPKAAFAAWREAQIREAAPPSDDHSRKGQTVFLSRSCVLCHTVRGTTAGGLVGPDLTHIGSRQQLASATLPLNRGSLGGWILDPQNIKPGAHMPATALRGDEVDPLISYLMGLK